jgi:hypothetical protein
MFDIFIKPECEGCLKRSDKECDKCFDSMPQKEKDTISSKISVITLTDSNNKDITPKISIKPQILLWVMLAAEKHNIEPLYSECFKVWNSWNDGSWLKKIGYPRGLFSHILSYYQFQKLAQNGLGEAIMTNGKIILLTPFPIEDWFYDEKGAYKKGNFNGNI